MKTISMPLDDYNKEITDLQRKTEIRSYTKGAIDMIKVLRDRLIYNSTESFFVNNEEATRALQDFLKDLKKHHTKPVGIISNENN